MGIRPGWEIDMDFKELQKRRYPPDGDPVRWAREGPPGHVNYEGGPVLWSPEDPTGQGVPGAEAE